ncbi:hypothetical protein [Desulfonema magnum]|uniref:Uncharacterized protein n=1 Tax=Desulfonema magnum TaxID=45655 RepID=A0A975BRC0_9BACT|nr:hypothetical protein [Desulfonema magnum]QTA89650.1 Uncharacterized protein dnm_057070 [Desulfonema magnum]
MNRELNKVLDSIANEYHGDISDGARNYVEVNIGKRSETMGYPELKKKYNEVCAIVPLKKPVNGMKVRIDGRTFVNYAQYDSGVAVPGYIAKDAGLPYKTFVPNDSMILNCTQ